MVKEIKTIEEKTRYNQIAKEVGNIFNTIDWLNIFGEKVRIFGIYDKSDRLIGGFSLYKFGFGIYRNPPFTPCIGPFLQMEAKNPVAIMSKWKEVMELMAKTIENLSYSIVTVSLNKDVIDTQPFIWRKFKVIPGYTYVLDLTKPIEDIWKGMSHTRRNEIDKGIRDGLVAKQIDDFSIVHSLVMKTFSRQGEEKKVNRYYLNKVLFDFANNTNSFAYATFRNGNPIATSLCVYDNDTAYLLLGGYDHKNKHRGAKPLAVWMDINHAKELGLKYFDFEGSMLPQVEQTFRDFGGRLTPYFRINKAKLPLEILLKFIKRERF